MDTPVCDFVREYRTQASLRLHMPGHKGAGVLGVEALDITEINGADVLYRSKGILRQSEDNAAKLFGAARTVYSAEGSSLCIRAMLYLALLHARKTGRQPIIAAGRNAHQVFFTAAALLDFKIQWLYPPQADNLISCEIDAKTLDAALSAASAAPAAVYITSPDYLGSLSDISALAEVCHRHGALLLVDNAHGAYLRFLPSPIHPMDLGADLCCDSAHKTLPVLTGGAYLHIGKSAPIWMREQAEQAMAVFASTSPSYLILQSLDAANRYLSEAYPDRLAETAERIALLKAKLTGHGYTLIGAEPLKLTVAPKSYGSTGTELAEYLLSKNIVCEFSDPDFTVMMFSAETAPEELARLETALLQLEQRQPHTVKPPLLPRPISVLSARQALLSPHRQLPVRECLGRILAAPSVSCPPAIPIVACGEEIDAAALRAFAYYDVDTCLVTE